MTKLNCYKYNLASFLVTTGHDIHISEEDIAPHTTRYNLTGVFKEANTRFYTNIIAYNAAGLYTAVSSDGCQIDKDIPVSGVVFDGLGNCQFKKVKRFPSICANYHC